MTEGGKLSELYEECSSILAQKRQEHLNLDYVYKQAKSSKQFSIDKDI